MPRGSVERYVIGDAAQLPFPSHSFDAVISNHSLEHFARLEEAVREVGRVLKPRGVFCAAVPDASTLTDHICRWLARGGGHVNGFRRPEAVIGIVERLAGLKHSGTNVLFSSLSFLNSHNFVAPPPRRIALFASGSETYLMVFTWILRLIDRLLGTRLTHKTEETSASGVGSGTRKRFWKAAVQFEERSGFRACIAARFAAPVLA